MGALTNDKRFSGYDLKVDPECRAWHMVCSQMEGKVMIIRQYSEIRNLYWGKGYNDENKADARRSKIPVHWYAVVFPVDGVTFEF